MILSSPLTRCAKRMTDCVFKPLETKSTCVGSSTSSNSGSSWCSHVVLSACNPSGWMPGARAIPKAGYTFLVTRSVWKKRTRTKSPGFLDDRFPWCMPECRLPHHLLRKTISGRSLATVVGSNHHNAAQPFSLQARKAQNLQPAPLGHLEEGQFTCAVDHNVKWFSFPTISDIDFTRFDFFIKMQ